MSGSNQTQDVGGAAILLAIEGVGERVTDLQRSVRGDVKTLQNALTARDKDGCTYGQLKTKDIEQLDKDLTRLKRAPDKRAASIALCVSILAGIVAITVAISTGLAKLKGS